MSKIKVKPGDRWAILGATGSGKTTFTKQLLAELVKGTKGLINIFILDSKVSGDFKQFYKKGIGCVYQGNVLPPLQNKDGTPFIVWQPEEDDIEMYNEFFKMVYQAGRKSGKPAIIYIDELGSICNAKATVFPRYYDILLKQGRGMMNGGIGLISTTQSPSFTPSNLLRQTTHLIRMRLNSEYDTKKLSMQLGKESEIEPQHDFGFYYRDCTKPRNAKNPTQYYEDLREFFNL